MKKILVFLLVLINFSCSQAQKTTFSKEALSETLLATDGKQVAFKDILKKYKGKTLVDRSLGFLVWRLCESNAKNKRTAG